ncbi:hypothetical protein B0H10DRAFT_2237956 [Mycena sp. CBHHK59/15]|nr:hypothetical protein B0H10DRAFT_2241067 [Mycena sp. CBHHK59/15]KAJ6570035.1 hypothetical protein B0H10DRAFT_2237956 [Mycena sp. CBHHK59/15]
MFVNQSDVKYQPKKHTIITDEGKTVTVYTLDPSIFDDEKNLSHIRFDESHANYRRCFLENAPVEAAMQLELYDNHRQRCWDIVLVDEKDFVMWNEEIYHQEFAASRALYFENKLAGQMAELESVASMSRVHGEIVDAVVDIWKKRGLPFAIKWVDDGANSREPCPNGHVVLWYSEGLLCPESGSSNFVKIRYNYDKPTMLAMINDL